MKVRFELFRVKQVNLHANIQSSDRTESVVSSVNMLTVPLSGMLSFPAGRLAERVRFFTGQLVAGNFCSYITLTRLLSLFFSLSKHFFHQRKS